MKNINLIGPFWKAVSGGLILLSVLSFTPAAFAELTDAQVAEIPAGDQPIKFSHKIHAGDNKIQCQYCHIYARRSWSSGVPPVKVCMGCHNFVATDLAEIQKLTKYWDDKKPIPWVKKHDVPDFVRFPHKKHINAKNEVFPDGVPCQKCHGPIETLDVVEVQDPKFGEMGWCLKCHLTIPGVKERKKNIKDENGKLPFAMHPKGHHRPALTDCLTCHK
ncbi:MAG: cytochrome c family protein [Deltaproteobacteria bacterium]|nr:cytochrome c family protein [Deltaproteobacteria bacterium]